MLPKVLKYPNFSKLFYAGLTSELGSFITETALMLTVFELSSNNKSYLGAARAIFLFFLTFGNIIGGPLGEKFNRRFLLNFTNYARIPIIASLFFIKDVNYIICIDGLIAFFTGIYNPTRQTMINDMVPQDDIPRANAMFGSTFAILHMLGPFLGATLYSAFKGINEILVFDLLTYFVGIYLITRINYKPPKYEKTHGSIFTESKEGFKHIARKKELSALVFNSILAGFCIGFLLPLLLPYLIETLKLDQKAYGQAFSCFGLGGLIGGWLSQKISDKFNSGKIIMVSLCIEPIIMILWLYFPSLFTTLLAFLLWGIVVFLRITSQLNFISHKVETKYLSRVFAILDLSFVFPNILSGIIVSFIGNQYSAEQMLTFIAYLFFVFVFLRLFSGSVRALYLSDNSRVQRDTSVQDKI